MPNQSYGRGLIIQCESLESLLAEWRAMPWYQRAWIHVSQFFRYQEWRGWFERDDG